MKKQPPQQTAEQPPPLTKAAIDAFHSRVYAAARANPRRLPWRETTDPYCILVSEIMLQQTQVERVVEKYLAFIARFPSPALLADADLQNVLTVWQGLGYNRRALALKRAAELIQTRFGGSVPVASPELVSLPGIGPNTAGAIMAFAFDRPAVFIETNIRSVFIHCFFPERTGIHDREILPLVAATMDRARPRCWYNALMDFGVTLKREGVNPSRKSAHHIRQTPFAGSNRQQRSALLKAILSQPGISGSDLLKQSGKKGETAVRNLDRMIAEGLIICREGHYFVP